MVFPRFHAVVLVHGCFWHGHDCPMFKLPLTRRAFWMAKIAGNRERDSRVLAKLSAMGWRTLVVWECMLRGPARRPLPDVLDRVGDWLRGDPAESSI
jgi:DNA mismatch endonuclease (patch repair protein)